MSAEIRSSIYLRCDANWSDGERCKVTLGRGAGWPNTEDATEALSRTARESGWRVTLTNRGLKGTLVESFCPDHTGQVDTEGAK